jgi:hypothetical protein
MGINYFWLWLGLIVTSTGLGGDLASEGKTMLGADSSKKSAITWRASVGAGGRTITHH